MVLRSLDGQELKSSSVPPSRQHPVASGNRPMTTDGEMAGMKNNHSAIDADGLWRRGYRQVRVFHHHHHYHVLVKPKASNGGGSRLRPKASASSPSLTVPSLSGQESVSAILRKGGRLVYCSQQKVSKVEPGLTMLMLSHPCTDNSPSCLAFASPNCCCPLFLLQTFKMSHWSPPPAPFQGPYQSRQPTPTCLMCRGNLSAISSSEMCLSCEDAVAASANLQDTSPPNSIATNSETPTCLVCMGLDPRHATGLCRTCEGAVAGPELPTTQQLLPNPQLARKINFEGDSGGTSKIGAIQPPSPSRTAVVFPLRPRILW